MRCLLCRKYGVLRDAKCCPECGVLLAPLLRDTLRPGATLDGGRYTLDYPIGQGGFGITYQGHHRQLNGRFAIKEFFPRDLVQRDPDSNEVVPITQKEVYHKGLRRFVNEGETLAQINHPHIVRAVDLFDDNGTCYLVMELIQGKTLREELDRAPERRLPEARVRAVTAQLVAALTAAHALSIWHLDLKPENVMVTEGDRIILLDFGAARQKFINLLAPLNVGPRVITSQAYTPEYAPPEVLLGWDTMGAHSDLFELGVMLYEMLYGKRPPPAFERYKQPAAFNPAGRRDSWAQLLMMALELDEQLRAADVAQWWEYETQRAQRAAQDAREQAAREAQRKEQLHEQERRRLVDDNQRLNEQVRHLQRRGTQALQDKSDLAEQLKQLQAEQAELLGELAWLRKYKPVMKALEHVGRWVWQIGQGALTLIGVALVILGWLLDQAAMIVGQLLIGLIGLFIKNDAWLVEQFPTERKRTLMLRLTGWPGFIVVLYMFYSLFGWFRSAA